MSLLLVLCPLPAELMCRAGQPPAVRPVGYHFGDGLDGTLGWTMSAIIGALRGCDSRGPADVLKYLNRVLFAQVSGFVTCCAALVASDGATSLANAGNPAPYCNGEEMAVEPGLPLGLLARASYAETHFQLHSNDRLTFVSDGVVEATSPTGELFGFERTKAIAGEPAEKIAQTAQQFGQEDDITVLTLTRESVGAPANTQNTVPSLSV